LKKTIKSLLFRALPEDLYVRWAPVLLPLFNFKRLGSRCKAGRIDGEIFECITHGRSWRFVGASRVDRYIWPKGLEVAKSKMRSKYLHHDWLLPDDAIILDVGANAGEFTAAVVEQSKIVASFEPDPAVFRCLSFNLSNHPNCDLVNAAAGDENGSKRFYLANQDADSSLIEPDEFVSTIDVNCVRLDDWIDKAGISQITLMKVEAEGFEPEVLKGAERALQRTQYVSVDASPERKGMDTRDDVCRMLVASGFSVQVSGYMVYAEKPRSPVR